MARKQNPPLPENYAFGHGTYLDPDEVYAPGEFDKYRYCDTGELVYEAAPRACPRCGEFPTSEGHDPCIANLPGVSNACCGHGVEPGYVQLNNGRTIRGQFDHIVYPHLENV
jgi:hypothetical protein